MDQEIIILPDTQAQNQPYPSNETERLLALSEFDLDYLELDKSFDDLTKLAAKVTGTTVSLINLIDSFTQWSVSSYGIELRQMPRAESVCQHTIMEENSDGFEVKDLSKDERFKDTPIVTDSTHLKYYFGIPLKVNEDVAIGALCVLHDDYKSLGVEKKEMLEIIAAEVVNRIKIHHTILNLKKSVQEANSAKNRVAHDIRGPIGGIIGLAEIIQMQGNNNKLEEVLDFISLIQKSGKSILELADEILSINGDSIGEVKRLPKDHEFTLLTLKSKLEDMFNPQALTKQVDLEVLPNPPFAEIPFPKNKVLQILGNLISNAVKFTPTGGKISVMLDMDILDQQKILRFKVKDNGVGISPEKIAEIMNGQAISSIGTSGEKGFGFGLNLVQHLVKGLKGRLLVRSELDEGTEFELIIPIV
jgi:signal transduction histidine kinase